MQSQNPFLDELSKAANAAASLAQSAGEEAKAAFRSGMDRMAADMDLIRREEFEASSVGAQASSNLDILLRAVRLDRDLMLFSIYDDPDRTSTKICTVLHSQFAADLHSMPSARLFLQVLHATSDMRRSSSGHGGQLITGPCQDLRRSFAENHFHRSIVRGQPSCPAEPDLEPLIFILTAKIRESLAEVS